MENTQDVYLSVIADGEEKKLIFLKITGNKEKAIKETKETTLNLLKKLPNYDNTNYEIKEKENFDLNSYIVISLGDGIVVLQNIQQMVIAMNSGSTK